MSDEWVDLAGLARFVAAARHSLFRMECRDLYAVDAEAAEFERYLRGEPGPDLEALRPWLDQLAARAVRGVTQTRVHIIQALPLSPYLRFQAQWGYTYTTRAGEDIRILDFTEQPPPAGLILEDFWLRDEEEVLVMHYDSGGAFAGGEPLPAGLLPDYVRAHAVAWEAAEPFRSWWGRHPQYHRGS